MRSSFPIYVLPAREYFRMADSPASADSSAVGEVEGFFTGKIDQMISQK